jgi:membrane-bound serine protease (ClpP class)
MSRGTTTFSLWVMTLLGAVIAWAPARAADTPPPSSSSGPTPAAVIRLEGKIDDYTRDTFIRRFNQAKAAGAKTVVIDLDTYGGLVTSGLDLSRFLKNQAGVRTVAYVGDKAISAGAMIALACDEIVMAPSAQLGDCAPIALRSDGGMETLGEAERAKSESPILSEFRDSAFRHGYDPLLAEAMVSTKTVVRWVEGPEGERRFVGQRTFDELTKDGWTEVRESEVPTPVDSESTLLTVSGAAAAKLGLAKGLAVNLAELTGQRNYNVISRYAPSGGDRLVEWLNNPFVRMILMILFAQALYAALHAPGHGFAETLAVLALAVLVGVPLLTGYAQWWEIVVILIGVVLLALELFVIPGFGVAGILGLFMMVGGLVLTFVGREPAGPGFWPELAGTWVNIRNGLAMVVTALLCSMVLSAWLRRYLPSMPYFNRLILTATTGNIDDTAAAPRALDAAAADDRPIVGAIGEALSELKPGGSAVFVDPNTGARRIYSVLSDVGYVARGTRLAVRTTGDNRIVVRPVVA